MPPGFLPGDTLTLSNGLLWLPGSSARFDFRSTAGATTTVPAGFAFTRAACVDSVQTGTSTLVEIASAADVLRYGRALDAWDVGLVLEKSTVNAVPDSQNYAAVTWTTSGAITRTASQTGPTGTALATRLEAAAGVNIQYYSRTGLNPAIPQASSQWMRPYTPPADVALIAGGTPTTTDIVLAAPTAWRRYTLAPITPTAGGIVNTLAVDTRAFPGIAAAARDWVVYGMQSEASSFPTSYVPTTGATATRNATFLRALSAAWTPWITAGRLSIELSFRAMGARTEYTATPYLWNTDANNYASFVPATGVLTISIAGATNTVTLPAWARYDLVELSVQCGGSLATVVKYRLNGGSVVTLTVTGSALGAQLGALDMYLLSSNGGNQLSAWLYTVAFWRGAPAWAS